MSSSTPNRVQPGLPAGGQFSTKPREEAGVKLVVPLPSKIKEYFARPKPRTNPKDAPLAPAPTADERRGAYIEQMIGAGELAPAARDMEPREAIEQWAQANAVSYSERVDKLAGAGLLPVTRADDIGPGEAIDLEPILTARPDVTAGELEAARRDFAEVSAVTDNRDGTVTITHSQGATTVDSDLAVAYEADESRCADCGTYTGGSLCDC